MINKLISLIKFHGVYSLVILYRFIRLEILSKLMKREHTVSAVYDFEMILPLQQGGLTKVLSIFRGRELDHKYLLEKVLRSGDTILDLGSNIGYYVALENNILNGNATFYCIEPDPRNITYLEKNLKLHNINQRAEVTLGAISDFDGDISFNFDELTNLNSVEFQHGSNKNTSSVPCHDILSYLKSRNPVDVIRMDIEGHELVVLKRLAEGVLSQVVKAPRIIIFETHQYKDVEKAAEILKILVTCGYEFSYVTSDDELSMDGASFRRRGLLPDKVIHEWTVSRGIYSDLKESLAVDIVSNWKGSRTVCLSLKK